MSQFDRPPGKKDKPPKFKLGLELEEIRYKLMSLKQLEEDPIAGPILQEVALEFLRTHDKEYFEREFTGELDRRGYLIPKFDANFPRQKPSQNISGGQKAVAEVVRLTNERLKEKYF